MNFTYENQGNNTYLVYRINESDAIDTVSLGMLTNNRIKGIAPVLFTQMDEEKYLKYNITAKVPVSRYFSGSITKKRLLSVFSGMANAILTAEEYMMDSSVFIFDLDYMFVDVSTHEILMICLPVLDIEQQAVDMLSFLKNIVFSVQYDQTENNDYITKIVNYLNGVTNFNIKDFSILVKQIIQNASPGVNAQNVSYQDTDMPITNLVTPFQVASPDNEAFIPAQIQETGIPQFSITPLQEASTYNVAVVPLNQQSITQNNEINMSSSVNEKKDSLFKRKKQSNKESSDVSPKAKEPKKAREPKNKNKSAKKNESQQISSIAIPGVETQIPQVSKTQSPHGAQIQIPQKQPVIESPIHKATQQNIPYPESSPQQQIIQPLAQQNNQQPSQQYSQLPQQQYIHNMDQRPEQQAPQQFMQQTPNVVSVRKNDSTTQPVANGNFKVNFGETTVLNNSTAGETTILNADANAQSIVPYLIRIKNNEKIILSKPVFRIGKEKSFVDYFIGDNTAISRSHADFISRDGEYFIMDMNSTNHTYINETMIPSSVEVKLTHSMIIRLANERFEFRIY